MDNRPKLPLITGGFLNVTQKCNLKCKYCFVVQQPKEMSYEVAKDAADFFANNAKLDGARPGLTFFGGEPTLRWKEVVVPLTEYIRETYGANYQLGITSNGVLLTRDRLEFLKKHNVGLLFSIDGDQPTQDLNRPFHSGKGSFSVLEKRIDEVLEFYPNMTFRATVDHDNVKYMAMNYQFAIKKGYTNVFMIPNVFTEWSQEEMEELERQVNLIGDIYVKRIRQERPVEFNHFSFAREKIRLLDKFKGYRDMSLGKPAFGRCGLGGTRFASIGASGNLYSCQELVENPDLGDKFKIGNIYEGVDEDARWAIMDQFDPRNIRRSDGKSCRGCELNRVCDGACTINNYLATGDLEVMPAVLCDYYNMVIRRQRKIDYELMPIAPEFV